MLAGFCEVSCSVCGTSLIRRNGWVLENEKLGQKNYCSTACFSKGRTRKVPCVCQNPLCGKSFSREPSQISSRNFCSHHCAATVLNPYNKKEKPPYIPKPRPVSQYTKENIIGAIQSFVSKNDRIPLRRELSPQYAMSRRLFGTWNKAIRAAGFRPNAELFSRRYSAKDGHICDSFAEKIIDDWLFERHIPHRIHVPYFYRNMSADFLIGNTLVEYFGLHGNMRKYDAHVETKKAIWKRRNLDVIAIYPPDLFPENKLDLVLEPLFIHR